jgi:hypothetical protein
VKDHGKPKATNKGSEGFIKEKENAMAVMKP